MRACEMIFLLENSVWPNSRSKEEIFSLLEYLLLCEQIKNFQTHCRQLKIRFIHMALTTSLIDTEAPHRHLKHLAHETSRSICYLPFLERCLAKIRNCTLVPSFRLHLTRLKRPPEETMQ